MSQIRSYIKYLIQTYVILVLTLYSKLMRYIAALAVFYYDLMMVLDSGLLFWGHPVYSRYIGDNKNNFKNSRTLAGSIAHKTRNLDMKLSQGYRQVPFRPVEYFNLRHRRISNLTYCTACVCHVY